MFQITSDNQYEDISDWCVFQIDFRLVSEWFQIGTKNLRLLLQNSDLFRYLQNHFQTGIIQNIFQTGSLKKHFRLVPVV